MIKIELEAVKTKVPFIYTEDNFYRKFRIIRGNRDISKVKIKKIKKSYENGTNLFPYCPILVNEEFQIIDGQHRYMVCKELRLPIYYIVIPSMELKNIAEINSNTDKWKVSDFLKCYIEQGNTNYQELLLFKDKYSLVIGVAASLLMDGTSREGTSGVIEKFRNGEFKVAHRKKAEELMKLVSDYEDVCDLLNDRSFIRAIEMLSKSEAYNHAEVVEKLKKSKAKIEKQKNYKQYIIHIENLFNSGKSKRYIIYK